MEERLDGGNTGGAVRVGETVRRAAGPWTPAVHAAGVRSLAATGDPVFARLTAQGVADNLDTALAELDDIR